MKPKIIIADDSQTVQKIVKIHIATLKEDPKFKHELELIECMDESVLLSLVKEHEPDFILLDFNLSKNKTGYDLAKEVKPICNSKIIMLFGSFDTIDESLFDAAGVNGHVLMPYDGVKIVPQIKEMLVEKEDALTDGERDLSERYNEMGNDEEFEDEFISDEIVSVEDAVHDGSMDNDEISIDDSWVVEQPAHSEKLDFSADDIVSEEELSTLEAGMEDWGVDVPSVIGQQTKTLEFPPIIEANILISDEDSSEELYPSDSDLEYPELESEKSRPSFISVDDLNNSNDAHFRHGIDLNDTLGTNTVEEIRALEEQISDEIEITSTYQMKDLWGSDEVESFESESETLITKHGEKDLGSFDVESSEDNLEFNSHLSSVKNNFDHNSFEENMTAHISEEEIKRKINELLEPLVEKIVREKVDSILEKISWEVLPDLAENLIKKELKAITHQVLNSD